MKKKSAILLCVCLLAVILCACGAGAENAQPVQNEPAAQAENAEIVTGATADFPYAGTWHEKTAGRGQMEITVSDNTVSFDVVWSDSASKAFVWSFSGNVNEAGVIYYSGGTKGTVEYDTNGNENRTVLSEDEKGSVEVLADGTLVWTESGETEAVHEFIKD